MDVNYEMDGFGCRGSLEGLASLRLQGFPRYIASFAIKLLSSKSARTLLSSEMALPFPASSDTLNKNSPDPLRHRLVNQQCSITAIDGCGRAVQNGMGTAQWYSKAATLLIIISIRKYCNYFMKKYYEAYNCGAASIAV
jgi:hypothetical protein